MNKKMALWVGLTMSFGLVAPALADDVDVKAFEYVDVIEKSDGSVLKGVIVEQVPGQKYKLATADGSLFVIAAGDVVKLTKEKNRNYRGDAHYVSQAGGASGTDGLGVASQSSLPAPVAASGTRIDFELDAMFPQGDIDKLDTSFAPTFRVSHEQLFGNFGLSGGAMGRFTYWMIPGDTGDAMWTLETHAFARATLHAGRMMPYVGLSLGTDINYIYANSADMSETTVGLGTNLTFGVGIAATPGIAVDFGGDYHPGTDKISSSSDASISYFALRLGLRVL